MNNKILVHVRPVITKSDYKETLARIEVLMDLSQKTKKEAAELELQHLIDNIDTIQSLKSAGLSYWG